MQQDLQKYLKGAQNRYGSTAVYSAGDAPEVEVITTGSLSLDFATGIMGIPRGRTIEIYGIPAIGKTALLYYMIAAEQKRGRPSLLVNLEGSFDPGWAERIAGIDTNPNADVPLIVMDLDNGKQAVEEVGKAVHSGLFGIVALDSIGAMLGEKESDPEKPKQAYGQSGLATHLAKLTTAPAAKNKTTCVWINQVRDGQATPQGWIPLKAPGGWAPKHQAAIRVEMKRTGESFKAVIDGQQVEVGFQVAAKIVKSKAGPPNMTAFWNFYNRPLILDAKGKPILTDDGIVGIDKMQEIIDLAFTHVIDRSGAYYYHRSFPEDDKGQPRLYGREAAEAFIRENQESQDALREDLLKVSQNVMPLEDKAEVENAIV